MKTIVISYSFTGNNEALAHSLAEVIKAEHVRITEVNRRTMGTIIMDLIFHRTPPVQFPNVEIEQYDMVLFIGPVWIGQIATPFRGCFKRLRSDIGKYAFISISGGADGPNLKLGGELRKGLNKEPISVIDLHIADLLPPEPKPQRSETSAYRINDRDTQTLTDSVVAILHKLNFRNKEYADAILESGRDNGC